jgi:hypothetical protein
MKIKTVLYGASLFLLTTMAYALDSQSVPQEPASAAQAGATAGSAKLPDAQAIRANIARLGIDPDSEKGRLLMQWSIRIAGDPALLAGLTRMSRHPLGEAPVSAEDRMRLLHLLKDMVSASPQDCHAFGTYGRDFTALEKAVSARTLRDLMEMLTIILKSDHPDQNQEEHYSLTELLDTWASLEAIKPPEMEDAKSVQKACESMVPLIDVFIALPEPLRDRATYLVLQILRGQGLPQNKVLEDPFAYLDDTFDERRLPEAMRRQLPADGSIPLPYSRITIDANWVNQAKPTVSTPFKDIFINRRNNGVIAELTTTADKSGATDWADFSLSYGIADIVSRSVGRSVTMLDTARDDASLAAANQAFVQGEHVDVPVPQQSNEARKLRKCDVGQTLPASSVFGSLTGSAIRLSCAEVNRYGTATTLRGAWLTDYRIFWVDSIDDDVGRTDAIVNNVAIQQ